MHCMPRCCSGNLVWNGDADLPLGADPDYGTGCLPPNPTCTPALLRAQNEINTLVPQLANPDGGDFRFVIFC